jgi:hypothetical protein
MATCALHKRSPFQVAFDIPVPLCQYQAMLGEPERQFSLTRPAGRPRRRPGSHCLLSVKGGTA